MTQSNDTPAVMTWLIMEDDAAIRDVITTMCSMWGVQAIVFKDGHQTSAFLEEAPLPALLPDLALLDIRVPGPWGHELAARIRQHPGLKNIGIILMTAYALSGADEEAYLSVSGADRLLYKPLPDMDSLLALAQKVIAASKNHSEVRA